jgi:hypothetical protein
MRTFAGKITNHQYENRNYYRHEQRTQAGGAAFG